MDRWNGLKIVEPQPYARLIGEAGEESPADKIRRLEDEKTEAWRCAYDETIRRLAAEERVNRWKSAAIGAWLVVAVNAVRWWFGW